MKPRPTIRQRLVASLSKRIKVVCVEYAAYRVGSVRIPARNVWECQVDGACEASGRRQWARDARLVLIQARATKLLSDMRALQRQGFKVTFP